MEFVFALGLIAVIAYFVGAPLREPGSGDGGGGEGSDSRRQDPVLDELESAKLSKYREIRDAELDHAGGKLNNPDFARIDAELRRDAIEILRKIDEREAELG